MYGVYAVINHLFLIYQFVLWRLAIDTLLDRVTWDLPQESSQTYIFLHHSWWKADPFTPFSQLLSGIMCYAVFVPGGTTGQCLLSTWSAIVLVVSCKSAYAWGFLVKTYWLYWFICISKWKLQVVILAISYHLHLFHMVTMWYFDLIITLIFYCWFCCVAHVAELPFQFIQCIWWHFDYEMFRN